MPYSGAAAVAVLTVFAVLSGRSQAFFSGYTQRQCTPTDDRCAGAEGMPFVQYASCCESSKTCIEDASKGWGAFCVGPPAASTGNCYATGERCMGAPGKPYVVFRSCCAAGELCVEDAALGWGSYCKPSEATMPKEYGRPTSTEAPVDMGPRPSAYGGSYGENYGHATTVAAPTATSTGEKTLPGNHRSYGSKKFCSPVAAGVSPDIDTFAFASPPTAKEIPWYYELEVDENACGETLLQRSSMLAADARILESQICSAAATSLPAGTLVRCGMYAAETGSWRGRFVIVITRDLTPSEQLTLANFLKRLADALGGFRASRHRWRLRFPFPLPTTLPPTTTKTRTTTRTSSTLTTRTATSTTSTPRTSSTTGKSSTALTTTTSTKTPSTATTTSSTTTKPTSTSTTSTTATSTTTTSTKTTTTATTAPTTAPTTSTSPTSTTTPTTTPTTTTTTSTTTPTTMPTTTTTTSTTTPTTTPATSITTFTTITTTTPTTTSSTTSTTTSTTTATSTTTCPTLRITLTWMEPEDLDLFVKSPSGESVFDASLPAVPSGGHKNQDDGVYSVFKNSVSGIEWIEFPCAVTGTYTVRVQNRGYYFNDDSDNCDASVDYVLTATKGSATVVPAFTGSSTPLTAQYEDDTYTVTI